MYFPLSTIRSNNVRAERGRGAAEPNLTANDIAEMLLAYFIAANYQLTRKAFRSLRRQLLGAATGCTTYLQVSPCDWQLFIHSIHNQYDHGQMHHF